MQSNKYFLNLKKKLNRRRRKKTRRRGRSRVGTIFTVSSWTSDTADLGLNQGSDSIFWHQLHPSADKHPCPVNLGPHITISASREDFGPFSPGPFLEASMMPWAYFYHCIYHTFVTFSACAPLLPTKHWYLIREDGFYHLCLHWDWLRAPHIVDAQ